MLIQAIEKELLLLRFVLGEYKTKEIYERAIEEVSWISEFVPDQYKTEKM